MEGLYLAVMMEEARHTSQGRSSLNSTPHLQLGLSNEEELRRLGKGNSNMDLPLLGTHVLVQTSSYSHSGWVLTDFSTRAGRRRVVVEFDPPLQGMLYILRPDQCTIIRKEDE